MTIDQDSSEKNFKQSYTQLPKYTVTREVLLKDDISSRAGYEQRHRPGCLGHVKNSVRQFSFIQFILKLIPVLKWLPEYSIKEYLPGDITAGITVAVMHIPQGMAYGLLAGVTPSSGLYMAFFPTLIYFAFGTSRHISVGTLSVISLMTLKLVQTYATVPTGDVASINTNNLDTSEHYTAMQVVTATAFMCGVHQIVMSFFRLGSLSSLLSDPLVNGFTTGAAVHVTVSQLKDLFGIQIPRHKGAFKIIFTVLDCFKQIPNSNVKTVIVSCSVVIFMIFMNEIMKPRCAKLCKFPLPAELLAVVGGTLISYLIQLGPVHHVRLVGHIPLGLPLPEFPPVRLLGLVAIDSIAISIVSYTVTISMALIFAKKRNYEVRANQELLAMGLSNIVGGMFSCVPNATSLSRSLIQDQTGGKTQIASVVSAFLILVILLWIGPFFEVLPRCVLSGIILVALKGMFLQAADLPRYHREGKLESLTWIVTFGAVVLVDVDVGLFFGLCASILALYIKGWKSQCAILGVVPKSDIYVNIETHKKAVELPNMKIFQYIGAINFASCGTFKRTLYKKLQMDSYLRCEKILADDVNDNCDSLKKLQTNALIIDLSCVTHMDVAACKTLAEIQADLATVNTIMYLACPNDRVFESIKHAELLSIGEFTILPSIHDAVVFFKGSSVENV